MFDVCYYERASIASKMDQLVVIDACLHVTLR